MTLVARAPGTRHRKRSHIGAIRRIRVMRFGKFRREMRRSARHESEAVYGTVPEAAHRFGLGVKRMRRLAREGAFPVYGADSAWPRVKFSEVEGWLRSTRVARTSHAEARVAEVIRQEGSGG